jgi:hypothetical protein
MAKEDYTVADRTADFPVTANKKVAETVYESPDAENAAEALAAGVIDNSFIDYEVALDAYAAREDIEDLDSKTRRTYGVGGATFGAAEHMRELPNRSGGNGVAPDPDNAIVVEGAGGSGAS